jgi:murein peptide amidase A
VDGGAFLAGWREREFGRSARGVALTVFLPEGEPEGLLVAALHGEEPETLLLARRVLEHVPAADSRFAVVPCLNPDGVLAGTRQNANGVDINRNFPSATWRPGESFTFPPGCTDRRMVNRLNRSSTGASAGSEPETQAVVALVRELRPRVVVDLHSPLGLVLCRDGLGRELAGVLAERAGFEVHETLSVETPGTLDAWCADEGIASVVYEVEHAALPVLCGHHLAPLQELVRGELGLP